MIRKVFYVFSMLFISIAWGSSVFAQSLDSQDCNIARVLETQHYEIDWLPGSDYDFIAAGADIEMRADVNGETVSLPLGRHPIWLTESQILYVHSELGIVIQNQDIITTLVPANEHEKVWALEVSPDKQKVAFSDRTGALFMFQLAHPEFVSQVGNLRVFGLFWVTDQDLAYINASGDTIEVYNIVERTTAEIVPHEQGKARQTLYYSQGVYYWATGDDLFDSSQFIVSFDPVTGEYREIRIGEDDWGIYDISIFQNHLFVGLLRGLDDAGLFLVQC